MNKSDLISTVAGHTGMPQRDVAKSLDGIVSAITAALKQGGDVRLTGFGTFTVAERSASTGRNPRTGEPIMLPASKQARFKAGSALKSAIN